MEWLRKRGMLVSALVGLMCTIVPAATENYLCWHWEIDGFKDAYWKCHAQSALGVRNETSGNYTTLEYRYEQMSSPSAVTSPMPTRNNTLAPNATNAIKSNGI